MTISQPPRFAGRLLKRLVPAQNHDALLGDLHEERRRGRSKVWYVFQILAAVVIGSWKDIRTHRLLTVGAIGIGVTLVTRRLNEGILIDNHWIYWRPQPTNFSPHLLALLFVLFGFPVSGWVIGRLSRAHGITFVVAFAAFAQLLVIVLYIVSYILLVSHIMAPSSHDSSNDFYVSPLWMILCIVIGGYFATRRAEAT